MAPVMATPMAATAPTSTFFGASGGRLSILAAFSAVAASFALEADSAAAARLATCSSIIRSSFLIGAEGTIKKAYRGARVDGHVSQVLADAKTLL